MTLLNSQFRRICIVCLFLLTPVSAWAETVGVFYDQKTAQITFAANEVKVALGKMGIETEMLDITALDAAYLALYYAYKIRAATFLKGNDQDKARVALGTGYGWWMKYSTVMHEMYLGMEMQRTDNLPDWHSRDQFVLKEFTDLGGVGTPVLDEMDNN